MRTYNLDAEPLPAAMGTLYLSDSLLITGPLTGKRFQYMRLVIPGFTHWSPDALTIDDCIIGLPAGLPLTVANNLVLTNNAELHLFAAPVANVLEDAGAMVSVGGNLNITGKSWIFPYADNTNGATVMIEVTGNMTVATDSGINGDYLGYTFSKGPGTAPSTAGGASYGGSGGQGYDGGWRGTPYGHPEGPVQAGSGGNRPTGSGQGGGAIRLAVGGNAEINGILTANGALGVDNSNGSGGSGGGIELTCQTLTGNGLLRADGGLGVSQGGSGGGGRIAVHYNLAAQAALLQQPSVRFSTYAFPDSSSGAYNYKAEMGTLYLPDTCLMAASPSAAALLDNKRFWHTRLVISDWTSWSPAALTISNSVIAFNEGFHLNVAGDLTLGADAGLSAGLNLFAAPTNTLYGARLDVGGDLSIGTNSWIYPHAHGASGSIVGLFVGDAVRVDAGGGINADGKGWFSASGNKQGPGAGTGSGTGGAGGYGGVGGGSSGGPTYGSALLPLQPGSPGAHKPQGGVGGSSTAGKGGGAIHLVVGGSARVDGLLSADGYSGVINLSSGGSGGAIFLALGGRLSGSGLLRARGVNTSPSYASGGGGRIAVWTHVLPTEVAQRIAEKDVNGLVYRETVSSFSGQLDVSVSAATANPQAGAGTAGFYSHASTLFIIR